MHDAVDTLNLTIRAEPEAVALARQALREFADAAGAPQEQVDAVRLAGSEAVTNAVVHAYRGEPGEIHLTAAIVSNELWVLIADDGCGMEPRTDRPGLGLGLGLIAQVADELAIAPRASGGTELRMRFSIGDGRPARQRSASSPKSECGPASRRPGSFRQSLA